MENLSRIKVSLAYAGNTGIWLAGQSGRGSRNGFQVVHQHHTSRFADAGKDFGIAKYRHKRTSRQT